MSIANDKIVNLQDAKVLYDDLRGRIKDNGVVKVLDTPADIQSFSDAARFPMELKVGIGPVQDLHGYDHPWPGGGGKNLLPTPYYSSSSTYDGITSVVHDDGSVTFNGTATTTYWFNFASHLQPIQFNAGSYILSCNGGGSNPCTNNVFVVANVRVVDTNKYGVNCKSTESVAFNPQEDGYLRCYLQIDTGITVSNLTIKPMIRLSTETDASYAPYSNICPITGWTGANVTVTGKNLWSGFIAGKRWLADGTESTGSENTYAGTNKFRITGNMNFKLFSDTLSNGSIAMMCFDENDGFIEEVAVSSNSTTTKDLNVPLTLPSGTEYVAFRNYRSSANGGVSAYITAQIMLSYEEASEYEAYKATVYPITFPSSTGTVYGGELTIHSDGSGELVVDREKITLTGSDFTEESGVLAGRFFTKTQLIDSSKLERRDMQCNMAHCYTGTSPQNEPGALYISSNLQVVINTVGYTLAQFKTYLNSEPLELIYGVKPVAYQLTPGQVFALLGTNNVWADCGQINYLEYVRDTVGEVIPNRFDGIEQDIVDTNTYEKTISEANAIQTFEDGAAWPMGMQIAVDPVQDLHGYSSPWPGGGGKNLFPLKAKNSYTSHGITFTPKVDDDGNVISIIVNGTNDGTASSVYDTVTGTVPTASARQTDIDFSKSYLFTGAQSENIALNLWAYDSNGTYIYGYYNRSTSATTINNSNIVSYVPIIEIRNGVTVNNVEVKPMLRLSTVSDATFEPYTNICPISGFTGAKVIRTGKNLLEYRWGDTASYTDNTGMTFIKNADGSITLNGTPSSGNSYRPLLDQPHSGWAILSETCFAGLSGKTIKISGGLSNNVRLNFSYRKTLSGTATTILDKGDGATVVLPDEDYYIYFDLIINKGYTANVTVYPMVCLESDDDGVWAPQTKNNVHSITFPTSAGTVYGGTLTVNKDGTGELVVDRTSIIASSSNITGVVTSASGAWTSITPSSVAKFVSNKVTLLCSQAMSVTFDDRVSDTYKNYTRAYIDDLGRVIIRASASSGINTVEGMKNLFDGAVIVYTLATPVTYSLTPGQVLSLLGQNHVWADTGDILSLTYNSKQGMEFIREDTAGQINTVVNPVKSELDSTEAAMAIVVDGDTAPKNITSGQYVFVKNHSTLATGMYHATAAISSGASITSNNVEADADGGFNALNSNKKNVQTAVSNPTASGTATAFVSGITQNAQGVISPTRANVPTASTSVAGLVQLNNTLTSTSTTQALTAAQGKALNGKMTRKTTVSGTTTSSGALLVSIPTGGVVVSLDVTSEQGKIALKRSGSYIHIYTPNNNGLEPYVNANVSVDIYYQIP